MTALLAVDPGKKTGWVLAEVTELAGFVVYDVIEWGETEHDEFLSKTWHLLTNGWAKRVICERYFQNTKRMTQQHDHPEIIGALRFQCRYTDVPFILQNVSDAKKFATPDKIADMVRPRWKDSVGYGGEGHAVDAVKHLVTFAETAWDGT